MGGACRTHSTIWVLGRARCSSIPLLMVSTLSITVINRRSNRRRRRRRYHSTVLRVVPALAQLPVPQRAPWFPSL